MAGKNVGEKSHGERDQSHEVGDDFDQEDQRLADRVHLFEAGRQPARQVLDDALGPDAFVVVRDPDHECQRERNRDVRGGRIEGEGGNPEAEDVDRLVGVGRQRQIADHVREEDEEEQGCEEREPLGGEPLVFDVAAGDVDLHHVVGDFDRGLEAARLLLHAPGDVEHDADGQGRSEDQVEHGLVDREVDAADVDRDPGIELELVLGLEGLVLAVAAEDDSDEDRDQEEADESEGDLGLGGEAGLLVEGLFDAVSSFGFRFRCSCGPLLKVGLVEVDQSAGRETESEDDDQQDRGVEADVPGDGTGDEDGQGHDPGAAERSRGDGAHRGVALAGEEVLLGLALGDGVDEARRAATFRRPRVGDQRQVQQDENRQRDRQGDQVQVCKNVEAASTHVPFEGSLCGERRQGVGTISEHSPETRCPQGNVTSATRQHGKAKNLLFVSAIPGARTLDDLEYVNEVNRDPHGSQDHGHHEDGPGQIEVAAIVAVRDQPQGERQPGQDQGPAVEVGERAPLGEADVGHAVVEVPAVGLVDRLVVLESLGDHEGGVEDRHREDHQRESECDHGIGLQRSLDRHDGDHVAEQVGAGVPHEARGRREAVAQEPERAAGGDRRQHPGLGAVQ